MDNGYYEIYTAESGEDGLEMQRAENALAELLRRIDDRELRDDIDRAAGTVGRLRQAEGFAAGYRQAIADR